MKHILKHLTSTGFKVKNKCNVLLSEGSNEDKEELLESVIVLSNNGFKLFWF